MVRTFTGNTAWTEASGPFPGWDTEYAQTTIAGNGYVDIDVTAMAQDWVNGSTNNGAGLFFGDAGNSAVCITREAVSGWESAQPKFIIDYTKTAAPGTYTATVPVTKDGAQTPGGSWYNYYDVGWAKMMYTNAYCYFYGDVLPVITVPGFTTTITSAKLKLYFTSIAGVSPYVVHTFTGNTPWTEISGPDPGRDTFYPNTTIPGNGHVDIDVTAMVQDWVNGSTNNGAGIYFGLSNSAVCISREAVGWDSSLPKFEITYVQSTFVPHGIVQGNITLSDFNGDLSLCPISVQLVPTSGGSAQQQLIIPTLNPMAYRFDAVTPGTYNVVFKTNNWLKKVNTGVVVGSTGTPIESSATLINGDLNGDNAVTSTDLNATLGNLDQKGD